MVRVGVIGVGTGGPGGGGAGPPDFLFEGPICPWPPHFLS